MTIYNLARFMESISMLLKLYELDGIRFFPFIIFASNCFWSYTTYFCLD